MGTYYHHTPHRNVQLILLEGLKPASKCGSQNEYYGAQGDPDYSYFWFCDKEDLKGLAIFFTLGSNPIFTIKRQALLRIEVDDKYVERDYDQLLHLLYDREITNELEEKVRTYAKKHFNIDLQKVSLEGIRKAIDSVPEESWRKKPGSYRTNTIITKIEVINWAEITPKTIRMIGIFTGPYFRLARHFLKGKKSKR